jgi:hypothetical protein
MRNLLNASIGAALVASSMMAIPASALADQGVVGYTGHDIGPGARPCLFFYAANSGWLGVPDSDPASDYVLLTIKISHESSKVISYVVGGSACGLPSTSHKNET